MRNLKVFWAAISICLFVLLPFTANAQNAPQLYVYQDSSGFESLGSADAPIHLTVFLSLSCPHCGNFFVSDMPKLYNDYIKNGEVTLTIVESYTNPAEASYGYIVARCYGDQNYVPILYSLLSDQETLYSKSVMEWLGRTIVARGLDVEAAKKCIHDAKAYDDMVTRLDAGYKVFEAYNLTGVPSVVIDGTPVSYALMFNKLDQLTAH